MAEVEEADFRKENASQSHMHAARRRRDVRGAKNG
jgi:hypothetical protein